MSVWDKIEEAVQGQPVEIRFTLRELRTVNEARDSWVDRVLEDASAWTVLRLMIEAQPELTKAVKGLVPHEAQLIKHLSRGAQSKTGSTGEVMALAPKEWLRIKQEIDSQPDYYDRMLGGVSTASDISKKIGDQLRLAMGSVPASQPKPKTLPGPEFSGKPADPTPIEPRSPFSSAGGDVDIDRRRRVAAQDAALMGGKTKPIGRVKVK